MNERQLSFLEYQICGYPDPDEWFVTIRNVTIGEDRDYSSSELREILAWFKREHPEMLREIFCEDYPEHV